MKAPRFAYVRAESLEQVLVLLAEHGDDARILAGGQSLMPTLNMRLSQPLLLIDINGLDALKGIALEGEEVVGQAGLDALGMAKKYRRTEVCCSSTRNLSKLPHRETED